MDFDTVLHAQEIDLYTDASRNFQLGAGGTCQNSWFILKWDPLFMDKFQPSIEFLELYAVVVAVKPLDIQVSKPEDCPVL